MMSKFKMAHIFSYLIALTLTSSNYLFAQNLNEQEYLSIQTFCKFIDWPENSNFNTKDTINILVISNNKTDLSFIKVFETKTIKNKSVQISTDTNIIDKVDIGIFFTDNIHEYHNLITKLKENKKLSIAHTKLDSQNEIIIKYQIVNEEVQYSINHQLAEEMGFKMNHMFLKQAKFIK